MKRGASGISCLIGIDKPVGPSSHDVVASVRRVLGERRVGHAGTLDPLASGVMVVGVGQATRLLGMLTLDDKTYEATVAFGTQTSTDDAEGEVVARAPVPDEVLDEAYAGRVVASLVGEHDQVPPAYSAISVGGKRAYARARSGEEVTLEPRHIEIMEASLLRVDAAPSPSWVLRLKVSKGTYVRSIARDLGLELGCHAHLSGLRRLASGCVGIERCIGLDELKEVGPALALARCLDPARTLGLPLRHLAPIELEDVSCGRRIELGSVDYPGDTGKGLAEGARVCVVADHRLYGVWRRRAGSLVPEASFPEGILGVIA